MHSYGFLNDAINRGQAHPHRVSVRKASYSRRQIQSDAARARVIGHDQIAGMSKTTTHFAFRVDIWDGIDFEVAEAAYRAAVARWPAARNTLRQGARVV
jgi:hypothetical protein